jgi:hypothetical protein
VVLLFFLLLLTVLTTRQYFNSIGPLSESINRSYSGRAEQEAVALAEA